MTEQQFLERLKTELNRRGIADGADIVEEYEQHFAFKLADGFSQEEIAAKLGTPEALAAQFGAGDEKKPRGGGRAVAAAGLCCTGLAAGIFFVLLAAWGLVLAAFSLCCAAAAVSLAAGLSPWSLIPPMPCGVAIILAVALAALAVLAAAGFVWFAAFLRQMARAYGRFHHNTLAAASGEPVLPSMALYPSFQPRTKRRLRRAALASLSVFAAFFVLAMAVAMLCSGSFQFWHVWGWFGGAA